MAGLSNVFHVAGDPVIHYVPHRIEGAIIVPMDVAVGIEVFADNCADDVWTTVDCEIGRRGIKYGSEASGRAAAGV